jgi:thiamine pyrophosphokinase
VTASAAGPSPGADPEDRDAPDGPDGAAGLDGPDEPDGPDELDDLDELDELDRVQRDDELVQVVLVAGGDPPTPSLLEELHERLALPDGWFVIAVDSGAASATALGWQVDLLVGDLDSVAPDTVVELRGRGADVQIHPADKDATDLELGLVSALDLAPHRVVVLGVGGGRADHELANILLLADTRFAAASVEGHSARAAYIVLNSYHVLPAEPGDLLSLLPIGGEAVVSATSGLRWPLRDAVLRPGITWGVSNEVVAPEPSVTVSRGTAMAVIPRNHPVP